MIFSQKLSTSFLDRNSFAIYGLGLTGLSVLKFFKKKRVKNFTAWDDNKYIRNFNGINKKKTEQDFLKDLDKVNYIVLSPGISIENSIFKKKLLENKKKIITDLDIFYILNSQNKSVMVTGSNGKSTTCKIIEHVLKSTNYDISLVGNIGKPILNIETNKNSLVVIEASSFQLDYSQFIKPNYAIVLNITNNHLDRHVTMSNYKKAKFKIFLNQQNTDLAFLDSKNLKKFYKRNNFKGKLINISKKKYGSIKKKIQNIYLKSKVNDKNMNFVYQLAKEFKVKDYLFVKASNSFKGLEHRHEIFYNKKNISIINDSKGTSFEATKNALFSNKNIYWILGGHPKKDDFFNIKDLKKNIIKAYIIGKDTSFFEKQIKNKIPYIVSGDLKNAIKNIYNDVKLKKNIKATILLSPAAASYDQFKNFEERGKYFKSLIKKNKKILYV